MPQDTDIRARATEAVKSVEAGVKRTVDKVGGAARTSLSDTEMLIRRYPLESVATALVAGAALAILVSRATESRHSTLGDVRDRISRTVHDGAHSVLPAFERMVDAVSSMSPRDGVLDKLASLGRSLGIVR